MIRIKLFKKLLIIVAITFLVISISYTTLKILIYKGTFTDDIIGKILSYWWVLVIVAIVSIIIYGIFNYFKNKPKEVQERVKEIVDTDSALEVFQEKFIVGTGISYIVRDNKIVPLNPKNIQIQNTRVFPQDKTNIFFSFEIIALEGTHYGVNVCVLRLDLGLEWIRKNWRSILKKNTTEEFFNFGDKERPLDVPESDSLRIALELSKKRDEGYEPEELVDLKNLIPEKKKEKNKEEKEDVD